MTSASTLHIDLKPGQSLQVGDTKITLERKDGQRARLLIQAPREVPIKRPISPPSAQECALSPNLGKEQANGQHPV